MDKELFIEIEKHLLSDDIPSNYLNKIRKQGLLDKEPYLWMKQLVRVEQSAKHHPEGNVWIHTMMVVDKGATYREKVKDKRAFMWALFLHDIGKLKTTVFRKGHWTSYDHDKVGEEEAQKFLEYFTDDSEFIFKVAKLIRYHMHLLFLKKNLPFSDVKGMLKYVDINDISYVFLADRLGRDKVDENEKREVEQDVQWFREKYGEE